jgi:molybdenum cofactor cytidylyltransferase
VRFGEVALEHAEGAILAHTHRLPARVLRKGQVLDGPALAALREAGTTAVIAATLEPGDVTEDEAAARLAAPLLGPHVSSSRAATGRVNLVAQAAGLVRVDAATIDRLNAVDESLTIGTLPDYAVVSPRDMLATIKVIPFAVPGGLVDAAERIARDSPPALALHPFHPLTVGLVVTDLPGLKPTVIDGTVTATEARIRGLTGTMLPARVCPHEAGPITAALLALIARGADLLLIAGASAVVDRRDVGPAAITRAGGVIEHFGMPVDPGNLICLGRIGTRPALVLPGCARSPKMNGIDFVLSRLFAGLPVDGAAVARMGVGGLLKEVERPLSRARATAPPRPGATATARPGIAAVVLAAGRSSRMAPHNKLLVADRGGKPMIARVVDNVLSSRARPILVVTGHMEAEIRTALAGRPVSFVHAEDFAQGLSASLKAGIAAVPADSAGALVCLGDMPLVTGRMMDRLLDSYDSDEGRLIVVPTHQGRGGNPMLWDRRFFTEILAASGDTGARFLLARHRDEVAEVELDADAILRDFDTVESLDDLPPHLRPAAP